MHMEKYGRRNWAVYDDTGKLVVVAVYKIGAQEVMHRLGCEPAAPSVVRELPGTGCDFDPKPCNSRFRYPVRRRR